MRIDGSPDCGGGDTIAETLKKFETRLVVPGGGRGGDMKSSRTSASDGGETCVADARGRKVVSEQHASLFIQERDHYERIRVARRRGLRRASIRRVDEFPRRRRSKDIRFCDSSVHCTPVPRTAPTHPLGRNDRRRLRPRTRAAPRARQTAMTYEVEGVLLLLRLLWRGAAPKGFVLR